MSDRNAVRGVERKVQSVTNASASPPTEAVEGDQLAREAIRAFTDDLATYRRVTGNEPNRFNPADPPDRQKDVLLESPPEDFTFIDFERLSRIDPNLATTKWEEVKAAARRDLDSGWLAGRALESLGGSAWERATFIAIRERFRRAWSPRNEVEATLLDELAQYELLRLAWLRFLSGLARGPETLLAYLKAKPSHERPKPFDAADATIAAMQMVERLQRLYHKALQSLVNLRRGKSMFFAQRAAQINVALGPQANACLAEPETQT